MSEQDTQPSATDGVAAPPGQQARTDGDRPQGGTIVEIEHEIRQLEALLHQLGGSAPRQRDRPYAPIPPEADPEPYVRDNLHRLQAALQGLGSQMHRQQAQPPQPTLTPPMNVIEGEQQWTCQLELPGIERSSISVELAGGNLHITAARPLPPSDGGRAVHVEASPCRFQRVVPLPRFVKPGSAQARLENGVLTIRFEKESETTRREISVTA